MMLIRGSAGSESRHTEHQNNLGVVGMVVQPVIPVGLGRKEDILGYRARMSQNQNRASEFMS